MTLTPAFPTILEDSLILAMLALKVELNNTLENNLAKEEYLPFTTGLIAMSSLKKRSFFPIVVIPSFSSVESSSKRLLNNAFPSISSSMNFSPTDLPKNLQIHVFTCSSVQPGIPSPVPKK